MACGGERKECATIIGHLSRNQERETSILEATGEAKAWLRENKLFYKSCVYRPCIIIHMHETPPKLLLLILMAIMYTDVS